ncbi:hypothetical protein [Priestia megaterium]
MGKWLVTDSDVLLFDEPKNSRCLLHVQLYRMLII